MKTLSEDYFREVLGFDTAGKLGKGIGAQFSSSGQKLRTGIKDVMKKNPNQNISQVINTVKNNPSQMNLAKQAGASTQAAVGGAAGKLALGGLYVGAAYLAYKGLMKLKDKLTNAKTPQEKQNIQKQVDQGQAKLQRAKELNKVKQKQESEKRQRDFQRK